MTCCDKYLLLISAAVDGEISGEENRILGEHLASCKECAELYDSMKLLSENMRETAHEVPDTLCSGVMQSIREIKSDKMIKAARGRRSRGRIALLCACVLIAVALVPVLRHAGNFDKSSSSVPDMTSIEDSYIGPKADGAEPESGAPNGGNADNDAAAGEDSGSSSAEIGENFTFGAPSEPLNRAGIYAEDEVPESFRDAGYFAVVTIAGEPDIETAELLAEFSSIEEGGFSFVLASKETYYILLERGYEAEFTASQSDSENVLVIVGYTKESE
jgi:hypothetical protein